jgi:hypothetical protein
LNEQNSHRGLPFVGYKVRSIGWWWTLDLMEGAKVELESEGKARLHGSSQHENHCMRRLPRAFVQNLGRYAPIVFEQYITVKNRRCSNVITMNR